MDGVPMPTMPMMIDQDPMPNIEIEAVENGYLVRVHDRVSLAEQLTLPQRRVSSRVVSAMMADDFDEEDVAHMAPQVIRSKCFIARDKVDVLEIVSKFLPGTLQQQEEESAEAEEDDEEGLPGVALAWKTGEEFDRICQCGLEESREAWAEGDRACPNCHAVWPENLRQK